jgi:sugar/nucleoside kinase (ribokinase family)
MDILTIGDCGIDLTMYISKADEIKSSDTGTPEICFIHGSKIPVDQFETSIAGNALNVAVGCNYLGLKTSIYSEIGDDPNTQYAGN